MRLILLVLGLCCGIQAQKVVQRYDFSEPTTQILVRKDGDVFVGTGKGLKHLKGNSWVNYVSAQNRPVDLITALEQTPDGTTWVGKAGYYGQGLERLSPSNRWYDERLSTANKKLPGNYITGLCLNKNDGFIVTIKEDRGGYGGAIDLDLNTRSSANWLSQENSTGCLCTERSCFVSTEKNGVREFTRDGSQIAHIGTGASVTALALDANGLLWIGLKSGGLITFSTKTREMGVGRPDIPQSNEIRSLLADANNGLWIGTPEALLKMDLRNGKFKVYEEIRDVRDLYFDPLDNAVWVAAGNSVFNINGASRGLTSTDLKALQTIADRKGLNRLDYNEITQTWSIFDADWITRIQGYFWGKNRFDIIGPLEQLTRSVEQAYWPSVSKDPGVYYLIERAYASLSALYLYYENNPDKNKMKQDDFMRRFKLVLSKFKAILNDIDGRLPASQ
jgi:hypothetical protein